MLASLQLKNYRCFDNHEVTFRNMNIVVGANNAGKSTLVEAIHLVGLVVRRYKGLSYARPPAWTDLPRRSKGVSPAMGNIDLRGGSVFHRYGEPPAVITAHFSNGSKVKVFVGPENRIFALVYDTFGRLICSKSRARDVELPSIAILPQIGPLTESEPLLTEDYVLKSVDTALASRHFRNQMHWLRSDYFEDFKRQAENSWRKLRIESLNVEGNIPDAYLSFHVRDTDFVAEVGWMGHGLQMWLQTMWFLTRSSQAETIILDEPDVYMHADLQRRLIRLLRRRTGQTVVATHSVEIMSEMTPDDILIVDKTQRQSSFTTSLPAVQHIIDQLGGVHNIHLARLWNSKRCIHIEGQDIALLRAFQDTLYPKSDLPFDVIPHFSIGGWSGWPLAIGSAKTLKNSAGEKIVTYCILDSDYHTEADISERYAKASENGIQLHIWNMKEIENYLLIPSAIARVITDGVTLGGDGPSAADVQQKIEEIAADEKISIHDALAHEYISLDRSSGIHGANEKARQRLGRAWKTKKGRFRVIPGKSVISRLSEWAKASFGVSFSPLKIALALNRDEIPTEMKSVVGAIERAKAFPVTPSPGNGSNS